MFSFLPNVGEIAPGADTIGVGIGFVHSFNVGIFGQTNKPRRADPTGPAPPKRAQPPLAKRKPTRARTRARCGTRSRAGKPDEELAPAPRVASLDDPS